MAGNAPPFQPMEPVPAPSLPREPGYAYEAKWDGIRLIAEASKSGVRLWTRGGLEVTRTLPEIAEALQAIAPAGPLWLDGEAVVLGKNGRPAFEEVVRRIRTRDERKASVLAASSPACYAVFDCLRRGSRTLFAQPWEKRSAVLREIIPGGPGPVLRVSSHDDASALWQKVVSEGWEGAVAKRRDAPYIAGKAHRLWWKVKALQERLFAVAGVVEAGGRVRSLLLALPGEAGAWEFAGRAGSGLSERDRLLLATRTSHLVAREPPFAEAVRLAPGEIVRWFKPLLTVKVAYRERTADGLLRHPRIMGFTGIPAGSLKEGREW